ncbi:MAG TPA: ABC transporter permease [Phycisphaerae bacterium]|nr:ABC transporter permease [Phycisphaerae bacterium]HNU44127.1 ABC transporter permease [Phycisphaerae bacterium]
MTKQTPLALWRRPTFWPVALLALLWLLNAALTPNFARIEVRDGRLFGSLIDVIHRGAPVMLLAVGMTLVIAMRGIDLSVGSVMAMAGAVAAQLIAVHDAPLAVVVAVPLVVAAAAGLWNGLLVTLAGMQPIVATLILLVAGRGVAQLITGGQITTFERPAFQFLGTGALLGVPFTLWLVAGVTLLVGALLRLTPLGLYVESIGGNERAARLAGVRVRAIKVAGYVLTGLCAGLAGLIATADIKAADVSNCGLYIELDAILAVVLGGTSLSGGRARMVGALAGALIMQTLTTTMLMRGIGQEYALVIKAVVALLVCLIYTPRFRGALQRLVGREVHAA